MSDLISRSKVISVLEQLEEHSLTGKMDISNAIYLLEKQPTAFDVDKVFEQLENQRDRFNKLGLKGEVIGCVSAIEIIKNEFNKIVKEV